ncbi:hypothetical protein G9U51_08675 [Calidifontibacter sp. DB0510]|uniref:Uncharacterized protein n=1 Tax=Metallococcus carri TaxID=1656884 RepID=A0A967EH28_9MICO|nr:hypothetical protein [Metallococcus carri]NHN55848.1 hypothetical protein [Metallococcus carri]NOP38464.1 hypothetical protein [Calidifontibacter sp. DB2511S]
MPTPPRRLIVLVVVAVLAVATVGVGVYGLLRGPGHSASAPGGGTAASRGPATPGQTSPSTDGQAPAALPQTDDPVAYAKAVASALFDWDTTSGYTPSDYEAPVLTDADPSGEEVSGLVGDVASYEPTTDQWTQLATMQVAQHLTISSAVVPSQWPEALAQAHGQLRPGTTAITISGTRHRTGVWYGDQAATSEPVSFTVFEACTPAFPRCHTLRLSQLNDPLK